MEPADRGARDPPLLDSSFELVRAEVRFPDYRKSIADGPLLSREKKKNKNKNSRAIGNGLEGEGRRKEKEEGGRNGMVPSWHLNNVGIEFMCHLCID